MFKGKNWIFKEKFGNYQNSKHCYTKNVYPILMKFTESVALSIFFIVLKLLT